MDVRQFFGQMAKADFADAVGLLIAEDQLALACVRKRFNSVALVAAESRPVDVPAEGRTAVAIDFLREFTRAHAIDSARLAVVLDRRETLMGHLQLPTAAMENLERVVAYELDRIIPIPAEQLYTSQYARPMGSVGERISVTVLAAARERVGELQHELAAVGFAPSAVTALPVALNDYYTYCRGEDAGVAGIFLSDDGDRESMTLSADGMLISSLRFDPVREERVERARRELEGVLPDCAEEPIEVIMGEGEVDTTLTAIAPDFLCCDGAPSNWAETAAIGAALGQLGEARVKVNLLPASLTKTEEGIGLREIGLSAAVVVVAAALASTIAFKNLGISNALAGEVGRLKPKVTSVTSQEERNRQLLAKTQLLEKHRATSVLAYLRDMTARVPKSAYLTTFRYKGDRIEVDGIADNAASLIALLEDSAFFANVEFTAPTTKYLQDQERFSLRMELEK